MISCTMKNCAPLFGFLLILTNEVLHSGCKVSFGSFRFHFDIKNRSIVCCKRLTRGTDRWKRHFHAALPSMLESKKDLLADSIEE